MLVDPQRILALLGCDLERSTSMVVSDGADLDAALLPARGARTARGILRPVHLLAGGAQCFMRAARRRATVQAPFPFGTALASAALL